MPKGSFPRANGQRVLPETAAPPFEKENRTTPQPRGNGVFPFPGRDPFFVGWRGLMPPSRQRGSKEIDLTEEGKS